ncbi:AAA [Seminavis robusta]|uniref:AAA n=1 Tax=Seminavis robusta TaxID=568900 RepID=A0A9N8GZL8_9STRA|nr:AAA [Seminavis robusta]|eukprot:Sro5_g004670.1 AAA (840) ;mRNA; f:220554-223188
MVDDCLDEDGTSVTSVNSSSAAEEDQELLRVIQSIATKFVNTTGYPKIISLLAEHPEGLTLNQLKKNCNLGFVFSEAKKAGKDFIPLPQFLSHIDGVCVRRIEGRDMIFPDDDYSSAAATPALPVTTIPAITTNGSSPRPGAAELLQLLAAKFPQNSFPTNQKDLKAAVLPLSRATPTISTWLLSGIDISKKIGVQRTEVIRRVLNEFKRIGCVSGTNRDIQWHSAAISTILRQEPSATETPVPMEASSADSLHLIHLIDTTDKLDQVCATFPFSGGATSQEEEDDCVVAVDCEGVPDNLFLIQVGTAKNGAYLFDCVNLGAEAVCKALTPLLTCTGITKLFHDLHNDAFALSRIGGVKNLHGCLDTQLVMEALSGKVITGFNHMLDHFDQESHPLKQQFNRERINQGRLFSVRPLAPDVLKYAALDVSLLMKAKERILNELAGPLRSTIQRASDRRAHQAATELSTGKRRICFNVAKSYAMASLELLQEQEPENMQKPVPLVVSDDSHVLLEMLPPDLRATLDGQTDRLCDINLDKGRQPLAWVDGKRIHLGSDENRLVSAQDIQGVVEQLVGGFGSDNRAGLERQLHRVAAIRNRQDDIIGLTLRVGRHVTGNAAMISDLLLNDPTKSILFLGEAGSGSTTVLRDVTRQLAERFNVCVVDTSNEIAGDGDIPHPCIGQARRVMVPSLDKQSDVMIECVQNHTPEVMVIDEISRPTEVEAARICKQRGVRLIASAHGDLRKVIKNPELRGLIGGIETVTQAKQGSKKAGNIQKLKDQRAGPPCFDVIVELKKGAHHEWRVTLDAGKAVDQVLEGQNYFVQARTRDPESGALAMALDEV